MNLSEIVNNVNAELGSATNINSLIKLWANRGQKEFISTANTSSHLFSWLALTELTLTTVANQKEYTLSSLVDVGKTIIMTDRTAPKKITIISRQDLLERVPNPDNHTGNPEFAYLSGYSPVANQPTSASTLSLVSSSASDTTAVVKIEGLNASGVLVGEEVTLDGVTPVVTTNTYSRVFGRSNNNYLSGILTITSNAGVVTNAVVGPRQRQGLYPKIVLYPTPSDARTLYYDAYMVLPELVNDNDFSLIPEQYHNAIEFYCLYRGQLHKKDQGLAEHYLQAFKNRIAEAMQDDKGPKRQIVLKSDSPTHFLAEGRLPGNYPRGY